MGATISKSGFKQKSFLFNEFDFLYIKSIDGNSLKNKGVTIVIVWTHAFKNNSGSHYPLPFFDFFRLISPISAGLNCLSLKITYGDLIHTFDYKYMNISIKHIKKNIVKRKEKRTNEQRTYLAQ